MPNYTYTDDGDSAVKNMLGARTHDALEKREAAFVFARYAEIVEGYGPRGAFDAAHLKAIHRHLFQDVYEWAGRTRDERVTLSDGTVASEPSMRKAGGKEFLFGPQIPAALDRIAARIRDDKFVRGLPRDDFAHRAADILADINRVHAFREGNGRTQRTFVDELAKQAGHSLDFSVIPRERMTQASIAANERGDPGMMRRLFADASNSARAEALRTSIGFLEQQGFPWNDRYLATAQTGHSVEVTMAGIAGPHFMARTTAAILIGIAADLPSPPPARGETFMFCQRSEWRGI